jgi:thiol-disulfide isomerase/thioredoxin
MLPGITVVQAKEPRVKGDRLIFTLPDLEGNSVSSSDSLFTGKVLFVTIWGTWCPPCVSEIPTFRDLQDRYGENGLVIVGIAFEPDTLETVRVSRLRDFSREHEINYLVLDGGATSDFSTSLPMIEDVKGLPIEIIIDRSGKVVESRNGYGYKKKWARKLEKDLKKLLESDDK